MRCEIYRSCISEPTCVVWSMKQNSYSLELRISKNLLQFFVALGPIEKGWETKNRERISHRGENIQTSPGLGLPWGCPMKEHFPFGNHLAFGWQPSSPPLIEDMVRSEVMEAWGINGLLLPWANTKFHVGPPSLNKGRLDKLAPHFLP